MTRDNVLITDLWRTMHEFARPQSAYSMCLILQALTLVLWWPKNGLGSALTSQDGPNTLLATLIAVAVTVAYQSIRCGAEELLGVNQHSLREWLVSTRVPLREILLGYAGTCILQTAHWLLLSLPIVTVAYCVGDGGAQILGLNFGAIFLLAVVYRLAGTCIYLLIGQHGETTWYALRAILIAGYLGAGLWFPPTAHWRVVDESLPLVAPLSLARLGVNIVDFFTFYACVAVVLAATLGVICVRCRRHADRIAS